MTPELTFIVGACVIVSVPFVMAAWATVLETRAKELDNSPETEKINRECDKRLWQLKARAAKSD